MSRDRSNNRFFVIMVIAVVVALYYGSVMAVTSNRCNGGPEKWIWVPPPHWQCVNPLSG
jgi:hypothetical protein